MKKLITVILFLFLFIMQDLQGESRTPLRLYLSTDIPVLYIDIPNTKVPENFSYGTGLIPSGLNMSFGLFYRNLGFSSSLELSFSGDVDKNSAAGVGDYFFLKLQFGPEIVSVTGKHMITVNVSFRYFYYKELRGAKMTAATNYDESYDTIDIETNRTGEGMGFVQFLRYDYFFVENFGIGPKITFTEIFENRFILSFDINMMYLF